MRRPRFTLGSDAIATSHLSPQLHHTRYVEPPPPAADHVNLVSLQAGREITAALAGRHGAPPPSEWSGPGATSRRLMGSHSVVGLADAGPA